MFSPFYKNNMIDKFWDAVDKNNYVLIESILDNNPDFLFENKQHYMGYNVVMYASINEKYDLIEILAKKYVNFVNALNSVDSFERKIPEKYICSSLAYLVLL